MKGKMEPFHEFRQTHAAKLVLFFFFLRRKERECDRRQEGVDRNIAERERLQHALCV